MTFDCNTTCVGIYADVQWIGKVIKENLIEENLYDTEKADLEGKIHDDLLQRFLLLEEEMRLMKNGFGQVIKIATGQKGDELDKGSHRFKKVQFF